MIVARYVFQAKWGKSEETVKMFRDSVDVIKRIAGPDFKMRVLTDLSGPFHTVVQELEVKSLADWERIRAEMFSSPEMMDEGAGGENPFEGGSLEFYTLEISA